MVFDPEKMNEYTRKMIATVQINGEFSSEASAIEAILEKMHSEYGADLEYLETWPKNSPNNPVDFETIKAFVQACFSLAVYIKKEYIVGLVKSSGLASKFDLEDHLGQLDIPTHPNSSLWLNTYLENFTNYLQKHDGKCAKFDLKNIHHVLEEHSLHSLKTQSETNSLQSILKENYSQVVIVTPEKGSNTNLTDFIACYLLKERVPEIIPVLIKGQEVENYDTLVQLIAVSAQEFLPLPSKELHRFAFDLGNLLASGSAIGLVDSWNANGESLLVRKIQHAWKRVIFSTSIQPDIKFIEPLQVYKLDQFKVNI